MEKFVSVSHHPSLTSIHDTLLGRAGRMEDYDRDGIVDLYVTGDPSHHPLLWTCWDYYSEWFLFNLNPEKRKEVCNKETRKIFTTRDEESLRHRAQRFAQDASQTTFCEVATPKPTSPTQFPAVQEIFSADEVLANQLYDDFVTALKDKKIYGTAIQEVWFRITKEGRSETLEFCDVEFVDSRGAKISVSLSSAFLQSRGIDDVNVVHVNLIHRQDPPKDNKGFVMINLEFDRPSMTQPIQAELNALYQSVKENRCPTRYSDFNDFTY